MAKLPASGFFVAGPVSAGGTKASDAAPALNDMRDVIAQLPGGWAETSLTIATGTIKPSSSVIVVDTEGNASTDDLEHIDPSNMFASTDTEAGRILLLRIADSTRVVRIRHGLGGVGQILTCTGSDITLRDPGTVAVLLWDPSVTAWRMRGLIATSSEMPIPLNSRTDIVPGISHSADTTNADIDLVRLQNVIDTLGIIRFRALDSASQQVDYASIKAVSTTTTSGTHGGKLVLSATRNGTLTDLLELAASRIACLGQDAFRLPNGNDAARPSSPFTGDTRYNTTSNRIEYRDNTNWRTVATVDPDETYTSSLGSGGSQIVTMTHSLGTTPSRTDVYLKCVSPEMGYAANDLVPIWNAGAGSNVHVGTTVVINATSIRVVFDNTPKIADLNNPSVQKAIDPTKWIVEVRLWR